jgi:hypothetical protein
VIAFVLTLIVGVLGFVAESEMSIFGQTIHFDVYGMPHSVEPK